jgi:hypothetical protein
VSSAHTPPVFVIKFVLRVDMSQNILLLMESRLTVEDSFLRIVPACSPQILGSVERVRASALSKINRAELEIARSQVGQRLS